MAQDQAEITREPIDYGRFINQFPPNTLKSMQRLERIYTKMYKGCLYRLTKYIHIRICVYNIWM